MSGLGRGLVAAEFSRFFHRKAVTRTLIGVIIVYIVGVVAAFVLFAPQPRAVVEGAQSQYVAMVKESRASYVDCAANVPADTDLRSWCGLPPAEVDAGDYTQFLAVKPFTLGVAMPGMATLMGLVFAVAAFVLGAAWIGAEWNTGSLPVLLTWEPRRVKLLATKLLVLVGAIATVAAALQAAWVATSLVLAGPRGSSAPDPVIWSEVLGLQSRLVVVAVVTAVAGFAIANLTRSTAGAIGVGFGYALAVEGALRWLSPSMQTWLLSNNVLAFVQAHTYVVTWSDAEQLMVLRISHLQAAALMTSTVCLLLLVGAALFRRRDLA